MASTPDATVPPGDEARAIAHPVRPSPEAARLSALARHRTMRINSSPFFTVPVAAATVLLVLATSTPWQLAPAWASDQSPSLDSTASSTSVDVDGATDDPLDRDELTVWIEPEPAPTPPPATPAEPTTDTPAQEQTPAPPAHTGALAPVAGGASTDGILADLNAQRAAAGLAPFTAHGGLNGVAQQWSVSQAQSATMYHNPSFGGQVAAVGCGGATENVASAMGSISPVGAWMDSPPHRANILGGATHIGVGAATSSNGLTYYTLNFARC